MSDYGSTSNITISDGIYSEINLMTSTFRTFSIGYAFSVIATCSILMNFVNKKAAILPILSAVFLICCLLPALVIDFMRPATNPANVNACRGRAVAIYIFSYLSQICLEIYQTRKITIVAHRETLCRYFAYVLFGLRLASIFVNLGFYSDIKLPNGMCSTGFPFINLLVEKLILLGYNLGNFFILVHIANKGDKDGVNFASITSKFLFQDGLTFILAVVLDAIYISVIASFASMPWIMSLAASIANGFNMFILHVKYCVSLSLRASSLPATSVTELTKRATFTPPPAGISLFSASQVSSFEYKGDISSRVTAPEMAFNPKADSRV
ncbi:hypothetical protein HDU97_003709 [Phlyctochytrium planicorne]|nr:hypothetical protein HDU97_003709 [Phlyctochytrium planicorne]